MRREDSRPHHVDLEHVDVLCARGEQLLVQSPRRSLLEFGVDSSRTLCAVRRSHACTPARQSFSSCLVTSESRPERQSTG
ncbi:MAG: hypothetical protein ACREU7_09820 [Burkholderiales bacterium]